MSSTNNWETQIAEVREDDVIIRGYRLSDLIGNITYTDAVFLVNTGELPTLEKRQMLDAILVALIEHGISPSTTIARTLASCGTPPQAAIAGAMLSIADWHGGSGEQLGRVLSETLAEVSSTEVSTTDFDGQLRDRAALLVDDYRSKKMKFDGFGHPQHPDGDPRGIRLLEIADDLSISGSHVVLLRLIDEEISRSLGRRLAVNVTGAIAAVLLDLNFSWRAIRGIVITARSAGLVAHIVEEIEQGGRWRHTPSDQVKYTGESERKLKF